MHMKAGIGLTDLGIDARAGVLYCFALFDCEKHVNFHYLRDYFGYKLLCMVLEIFFLCILDISPLLSQQMYFVNIGILYALMIL